MNGSERIATSDVQSPETANPVPASRDEHGCYPKRLPPAKSGVLRQALNELVVTNPSNHRETKNNREDCENEAKDNTN
jgi:hypothetical protein